MAVITKRKNNLKSKSSMKTKRSSKSKSNSKTRKQFKNIRKNGMGTRKMMGAGGWKNPFKRKEKKQSQLLTKVKSNPYEVVKNNPYVPEKPTTPTPYRTYTVGNETFTRLIPKKRTTPPTGNDKNTPGKFSRLSQYIRIGQNNNETTNRKEGSIEEISEENNI